MIVIRMNGWEPTFQEELDSLVANPGSCDEVWLAVYGYYPLKEQYLRAADFAKHAKQVRDAGFRPVFEMGSTLGHVPEMLENEVTRNFTKMTDQFGVSMPGAFCPRCENLRAYHQEVVKAFMQYKPYAMYIDDDMRLEFRNGVALGCFCDDCIAKFNAQYGYSLTREEISERFVTEPAFREQYIQFSRDGMEEYAYLLAKAAAEVAPESYVGFENCFLGAHTGGDLNHLFNGLYRGNGKPPFSRSGAFYYRDYSPRDVLDKVLNISYQYTVMPDYITVRRPEIENTDNTSMGKSIRGTLMESELNLALSCNGLSYHIVGQECEPVEYEARFFKALAEHRSYFEAIAAWAKTGKGAGLCPVIGKKAHLLDFISKEEYRAQENKKQGVFRWADVPKERGRELWQMGMPLSYESEKAYLLHPEMVPYLTDEEIQTLLTKNVMTDGAAIEELEKRGYGNAFPVTAKNRAAGTRFVSYVGVPSVTGRGHTDMFCANRFMILSAKEGREEDVTVLGVSTGANPWLTPLGTEIEDDVTEALVTTSKGGKWAVCGTSLFNIFINCHKRTFLLAVADMLYGGIPCRLRSSEQVVIVPRANDKGECTGVFAHSITISDTEPLEFEIRNPAGNNFVMITKDGETPLSARKEGDLTIVTAPSLAAYRSFLIVCR